MPEHATLRLSAGRNFVEAAIHLRPLLFTLCLTAGCYQGVSVGPGGQAEGDDAASGGRDGPEDSDGTGNDTEGGDTDDTDDADDTAGGPDDPRMHFSCDDEQQTLRGTTNDHARRLSSAELRQTMLALLGPEAFDDPDIGPRIASLPQDITVDAGDFSIDPPVSLALSLSTVAKRVAEIALDDPSWSAEHLSACAGSGTVDEQCAATVVRDFGARVWRRELEASEMDAYVAYFDSAGGGREGLGFLVRRLLQAPSLVFHIENGVGDAQDGRLRLSDFEIASRIAYATTDGPPDEALMAAARAGELASVDTVREHVRRLLASESARVKVVDFFRFYTRLSSVGDPLPYVGQNIGVPDTLGLGEELRDEAFEFITHTLAVGGTFADLMGSTAAFPRSPDAARIFGTELVTGDQPTSAPTHPGLLHRPAMLATTGARTSPILRGAHVLKLFMCSELPLPDPAAVEDRQDEVGDIENMSNRDRVTTLTDAPACNGCHAAVNPVGFTFEGYDQLGALRDQETVFNEDGTVKTVWPIDTEIDDLVLEPGEHLSLANSIELTAAMVDSYVARACISRRVFEYYHLRTHDSVPDGCLLLETEVQSHEGELIDVFAAAIANEDIFWKKAP